MILLKRVHLTSLRAAPFKIVVDGNTRIGRMGLIFTVFLGREGIKTSFLPDFNNKTTSVANELSQHNKPNYLINVR